MRDQCSSTLTDLAYSRALENAKKLNNQVEYFRRKKSDNREKMVALATVVLEAHMQVVEQMRLEYLSRHKELVFRN
jgi:hypothetical protein